MQGFDRASVNRFVLSHECASGGFSFSRTTPPTLEDTYYALRIFQELGIGYKNKKTVRHVRELCLMNESNMRNVYRLMYLLDRLSLYDLLDAWKEKLKTMSDKCSFFDCYYGLLSGEIVDEHVRARLNSVSGLRMAAYVPDVSRQAVFLKKTKVRFNEKKYAKWLREAQMPDGGYGFLKNSTSFMDTTYYALKGLGILDTAPADLGACRRFVLICKTREGFGRQINSLPTLEATYHAVACLNMLSDMEKR